MGTGKKEHKQGEYGTAREELVQELKYLRAAVRDVGEQFILRREGEIETIISHLAAVPPARLRDEAPAMLHEIRSLRLKPAKGRLKDLKGLDALIEDLAERVISAQDARKGSGRG